MNIGVKIYGIKEYAEAVDDYIRQTKRKLVAAFTAGAAELASWSRQHAPVSQDLRMERGKRGGVASTLGGGRLRASITSEVGQRGGELVGAWGTNLAYAPYLVPAALGGKDKGRIAGGRLASWAQGSAPITSWKTLTKRQRFGGRRAGAGSEALPILLPAWDALGAKVIDRIKKAGD